MKVWHEISGIFPKIPCMEYYHTTEGYMKTVDNVLRHSIVAPSKEDAEDLFVYAKNSLLSTNSWKHYSHATNTSFELTNNNGYVLHRHAHTGDNIRISIPGGAVYQLHIDSIIYDDYPDADTESITMYLNPVSGAEINHDSIFCTLAIERAGTHLVSVCTGVEEIPALSADQLNNLITGFIEFEEK